MNRGKCFAAELRYILFGLSILDQRARLGMIT
jgi:hypothetical protein